MHIVAEVTRNTVSYVVPSWLIVCFLTKLIVAPVSIMNLTFFLWTSTSIPTYFIGVLPWLWSNMGMVVTWSLLGRREMGWDGMRKKKRKIGREERREKDEIAADDYDKWWVTRNHNLLTICDPFISRITMEATDKLHNKTTNTVNATV